MQSGFTGGTTAPWQLQSRSCAGPVVVHFPVAPKPVVTGRQGAPDVTHPFLLTLQVCACVVNCVKQIIPEIAIISERSLFIDNFITSSSSDQASCCPSKQKVLPYAKVRQKIFRLADATIKTYSILLVILLNYECKAQSIKMND
jgi:hypothetical protein